MCLDSTTRYANCRKATTDHPGSLRSKNRHLSAWYYTACCLGTSFEKREPAQSDAESYCPQAICYEWLNLECRDTSPLSDPCSVHAKIAGRRIRQKCITTNNTLRGTEKTYLNCITKSKEIRWLRQRNRSRRDPLAKAKSRQWSRRVLVEVLCGLQQGDRRVGI